jgi:hypothetical protein
MMQTSNTQRTTGQLEANAACAAMQITARGAADGAGAVLAARGDPAAALRDAAVQLQREGYCTLPAGTRPEAYWQWPLCTKIEYLHTKYSKV